MIRLVADVFRTPDPRPETPMARAARDMKEKLIVEVKNRHLKTARLEGCARKSKAESLQNDVSNDEVLRILEQTDDRLDNAEIQSKYDALAYLKLAIANRRI